MTPGARSREEGEVVDHLRALIAREKLKPGGKLPSERELAELLQTTRGDVRRGIGYLAALGVLEVKHGVGAFLAEGTAMLGNAPLKMLRALGGLETWQIFEARRALEIEIVSLATERRTESQLVPLAEEIAEMFASVKNAEQFLIHDIRFHRAIAHASGNPILSALMEGIVGAVYEERRRAAGTLKNRTEALEMHREIYRCIRRQDGKGARTAMQKHLQSAEGKK